MKIKKGDTVKIKIGKDRGKQGKVTQLLPKLKMVVIEGLNKRIKHLRPRKEREKGQRIEFDAPVRVDNVQLVCPKCSKIARVGYKVFDNKRKERVCRKCKEIV